MDDQCSEMSVSAALDRIAEQLRGAKMLPAGRGLSNQLSFATPGFFRLDKVAPPRRRRRLLPPNPSPCNASLPASSTSSISLSSPIPCSFPSWSFYLASARASASIDGPAGDEFAAWGSRAGAAVAATSVGAVADVGIELPGTATTLPARASPSKSCSVRLSSETASPSFAPDWGWLRAKRGVSRASSCIAGEGGARAIGESQSWSPSTTITSTTAASDPSRLIQPND